MTKVITEKYGRIKARFSNIAIKILLNTYKSFAVIEVTLS
jgi:hypothetical protein